VAAAAGFAVVGAADGVALAGEGWTTAGTAGFGLGATEGVDGLAGEAWESSWGAADCGTGAPNREAITRAD
jgi:hypothetical protein